MGEQRFYYTARQCESRMQKLVTLSNDFNLEFGGTGRPVPSEKGYSEDYTSLMDLMQQFRKGNVAANPKATCAVGLESQLKLSSAVCNISVFILLITGSQSVFK